MGDARGGLGIEDELGEFAERAVSAGACAHVMHGAGDAGLGIGGAGGEAGRAEEGEIVHVVPDERDALERESVRARDPFGAAQLVGHAAVELLHVQHAGARGDDRGALLREDPDGDARDGAQALDPHPVAHREALELLAARAVVDPGVGEHAVAVREHEADARGPRAEHVAGEHARHHAVKPPSTTSVAPVMYRDASLARNTMAPRISSGAAMRASGVRRA